MTEKQALTELLQTYVAANIVKILQQSGYFKNIKENNILDLDSILFEEEKKDNFIIDIVNANMYIVLSENAVKFEYKYNHVDELLGFNSGIKMYVSDNITPDVLHQDFTNYMNNLDRELKEMDPIEVLYVTKAKDGYVLTTEPIYEVDITDPESIVLAIKTQVIPEVKTFMLSLADAFKQLGLNIADEPLAYGFVALIGVLFIGVFKFVISLFKKLLTKSESMESLVKYENIILDKMKKITGIMDISILKSLYKIIVTFIKAIFTKSKELFKSLIEAIKQFVTKNINKIKLLIVSRILSKEINDNINENKYTFINVAEAVKQAQNNPIKLNITDDKLLYQGAPLKSEPQKTDKSELQKQIDEQIEKTQQIIIPELKTQYNLLSQNFIILINNLNKFVTENNFEHKITPKNYLKNISAFTILNSKAQQDIANIFKTMVAKVKTINVYFNALQQDSNLIKNAYFIKQFISYLEEFIKLFKQVNKKIFNIDMNDEFTIKRVLHEVIRLLNDKHRQAIKQEFLDILLKYHEQYDDIVFEMLIDIQLDE